MKSHRRRLPWYAGFAVGTAAVVAGALVVVGVGGQASADSDGGNGWRSARLAVELKAAIIKQNFGNVLDTTPPGSAAAKRFAPSAAEKDGMEPSVAQVAQRLKAFAAASPAASPQIHQTPNVDAAVIELDHQGHAVSAANVLLSPQYPTGKVVPLDKNMATDQVRYRTWDDDTWDNNGGLGTTDAIPGRENAPIDFMSPYPASVFKLMVGFGIMQLVDKGQLNLDDDYAYDRTGAPNTACGLNVTKPIRQFFDEMITVSKNESACAMTKLLIQKNYLTTLNQEFVDLGLPMLQINGVRAVDGGHWGANVMSSLDTAKLLMIINGAGGKLWTAPNGTAVTKALLTDSSRAFYLKELGDQGLNQLLSTTNWCGRAYPAQGLPQKVADRWINPADGTMTVDGRVYGQDVRPCQATAQVTFAHKTGLDTTAGNDAGIVTSLPGKAGRHFIVVVNSNLGDRYIDTNRTADPPGIYPVQYTEKYGLLGKAIDQFVTRHHNG
ncbi:hypothetical protein GCM10009765_36720 [Fodinicola feengrottensis]|uniref:Beta-lactamase class A catalytic domain-containing protein n=1 Tax=Fodinicola feengrottensis TaxID=435914 RepID=A0ABP4T8N7_9ACTN